MTIDLPEVFPESLIALDTLNAYAKWKIEPFPNNEITRYGTRISGKIS